MRFAEIIDDGWSKNDAAFNEKYFKDSVALAILFKHTEWVVSHQPWFEQGYRANIVTYTLALLHRLILQQYKGMDLDLQLIWNRQQVPEIITNELVKITKYVFERITDPHRGTINVTQWCKREACWDSVKICNIKLSDEFRKVLLGKDEAKAAERDAKKDQKLISDVQAQAKVLELGADFWKKVNSFVMQKRVSISPDQMKALKYAVQIPVQFPSAYQSLRLLELLENAEANGFKA